MKKKNIILIIVLALDVLIISTILGYFITKKIEVSKIDVSFDYVNELEKEKVIEVFSETFTPSDMNVSVNGEDKSELLQVDYSNINLNKIGEYIVKYYIIYNKQRYEELQTIKVVDTVNPEISLEGGSVTILLNEEYKDPGYKANDNYDGDLTDKVEIVSDVNNKEA